MKRTPALDDRRGMLLLMVILMLSLFMAIGAMLLTIAARARAAARASTRANQLSNTADSVARDALDNALLALLRGANSGTNGSVAVGGILENLLEDKYGPSSIVGTGTSLVSGSAVLTGTNTPVISFQLASTAVNSGTARLLGGRIATIIPQDGDGDISSHRILGVLSATGTLRCILAQLSGATPRTLPRQPFSVIINGREFTPAAGTGLPESYDAYDDANAWLAQPVLADGQLSGTSGSFARISFGSAAGRNVDNDNDGVLDGAWIPPTITTGSAPTPFFVIPDQPSPLGGTLRFQVSYLVLDLDGRINVNTAGMATPQDDYSYTANVPIGMGYGPADINCSLLFPRTAPTASGTYAASGYWANMLRGGTPTTTPAVPTAAQRRTPPVVGRIDGRSGTNAVPGVAGDDVQGNQQTRTSTNAILNLTTGGTTESIYTLTLAGANAVADLKAQTRVYMSSTSVGLSGSSPLTPTLNFYRPTWAGAAGADGVDDPYETRLDTDAPRPGAARRTSVAATANDDSPYTLAELERILRPNDPDAPQLPQRLAAGLEDLAQQNRTTITTDSWSTPGLTGLAARQLEDFFTGPQCGAFNVLTGLLTSNTSTWVSGSSVVSPDVAAGLRFNINRPVLSGTTAVAVAQQQQYCKDLYTLVMALATGTGPAPASAVATQYAQWAVNVLDFRDADSIMTRFQFDTNLADGWFVDASSPVVYGAERPEVVIVETAAWRNTSTGTSQLFVNLHRPAVTAVQLSLGSGTTAVSGTTEVSNLATSGTIVLSAATRPWLLRFGGTNAVAFVNIGVGAGVATTGTHWVLSGTAVVTGTFGLSGISGGGPSLAATGTGSYLCVQQSSPVQFGPSGIRTFGVNQGAAFQFPHTATSGTVQLQRLANPSVANSSTNPYVVVDTAVLSPIVDVSDASAIKAKNRRPGPQDTPPAPIPDRFSAFWRQPTAAQWVSTGTTLTTYTAVSGTNPVAWFHWPNRPFISQAELALVPTGSAGPDGMLANYSFPTNSLATSTTSIVIRSTTTTLGAVILDATYVPSKFADNAVTITATAAISVVGLDNLRANHFSKWREPGRVNVNTIVSGPTVSGSIPPVMTSGSGRPDDFVWGLLTGGTALTLQTSASSSTIFTPQNPFVPLNSGSVTPAASMSQLLSLTGTSTTQPIAWEDFTSTTGTFNPRDKNPYLAYARAIRLANTATVQSNVFAVWITVRITDDSPNAPSPVTRRLFAIVDRSIPVGYLPNRDLNVREVIRLKRYLE